MTPSPPPSRTSARSSSRSPDRLPWPRAAPASVSLESYGATILRITLGVIFVMHAYLALMVMGPRGTIAFQHSLGLPIPEIGAWYLIVAHGLGARC